MRWFVVGLLVLSVGVGCSDNEANLVTNNSNAPNNENNKNNTSNNTNNTSNNQNNTNNTSNNRNNTNNTVNSINNFSDTYDVDPGADTRDYRGTVPPNVSADPVETFIYDVVVAYCERLFQCRTEPTTLRAIRGVRLANVGQCVQEHLNRDAPGNYRLAVDEGRAQFFAGMVSGCTAQFSNLACPIVARSLFAPRSNVQLCSDALVGLTAEGLACGSNADCGIQFYCDRVNIDTCAGSCQTNAAQGTVCGDSVCDTDQYCETGAMACIAKGGDGAACANPTQCQEGFFCRNTECKPVKVLYQEGEVCSFFGQLCAPGMYCAINADKTAFECAPYASSGQSCGLDVECEYSALCNLDSGSCEDRAESGSCRFGDVCTSFMCGETGCIASGTECSVPPPAM